MKKAFIIIFSLFALCTASAENTYARNPDDVQKNSGSGIHGETREHFQAQSAFQQTVDDKNAIAVTFSMPLETTQNLDTYFDVFTDDSIPVEGGWVLSDDPQVVYFTNIEPDTHYTVTVYKGVKNQSGHPLGKQTKFRIKTRPVQAMITFGSNGFILPATLSRGLPVNSVNVKQADIDFFKVKKKFLNDFSREFAKGRNIACYRSDELNRYADLVYSGRWDLDIHKDLRTKVNIPITHISQLKEAGVYVAVLKGAGKYDYQYGSTWFTISDLGLHVRKYSNAVQVQVQSLETGRPVSNALISAYNKDGIRLAAMKTDTRGLASVRGNFNNLHYITGEKENHITLLPMDVPAMDLTEFKAATEPMRTIDLFVYGPRDLYRPGETVILDGILRKHDGRMTAGLPVKTRIYRPDGRMLREFTWKTTHLNYYHYEYLLPGDAITGTWRIEFEYAGTPLKPFEFTVAEFLPERMKLSMDNPRGQGDILKKTDTPAIELQGDYLYGAPASGSRADARIRLQPARELFPQKWPGYMSGDVTDTFHHSFQTDRITLDEQGRGILKIQNQWDTITSPAQLTANASLYEPGGRPVVRTRSWQVWPAPVLVAIRSLAEDNHVKSNTSAEFEIIALDTRGKRISAKNLKAVVIREHRDYYWEYKNNAWQWRHTRQFYPVDRFSIDIPEDGPASVQVPVKWGGYRLEITHPATGLVTSYSIRAGWSYASGDGQGQGTSRPDRVDLSLDKPVYRPGETAKIMVKAPEGGSGYVFVETDTNLLTRPVTIPPEGKTIEIRIDPSWQRHDIYISALIVRPGEVKIEALPKRSVGLIHLPLERSGRRLFVDIDVPDKIEADRTIDIPVIIKPHETDAGETGKHANNNEMTSGNPNPPSSGAPMEGREIWVTLAAVDMGVLNLTGFETPSPFDYFFQPRRYGVELRDPYQKLIETEKGAWASQRFGGDAPMLSRGGDRPSTDVRIVAISKQAVRVNKEGIATFPMNIPDFNGAVRFMAVAHGGESFGAADKEVTITTPVVVQIAMPRFLSMGDRSQLMLNIHNLSGSPQRFDLSIHTGAPVKTIGQNRHHLTLENNERVDVPIRVFAEQKTGRADIICTIDSLMVAGKKRKIVKKWFLETRPAYPALTTTWRKQLAPGEAFSIEQKALSGLIEETVTVEAGLNSTPPVNISGHIRYLNAYPYGCLEQITSGLYPHVILSSSDLAGMGISSQDDQKRSDKITSGIPRLMEKQKSSGGFGLWGSEAPEDFWLTPYVTDFLLNAGEAGYEIPEAAISKALDRLLRYVRRKGSVKPRYYGGQKHYPAAVRAYAAMVLARVQKLTLGDARALYRAEKDNIQGSLGLVQIGIALYLSGDRPLAMEAFAKALETRREDKHYYGDYGSNLRDFALSFHLLSTHCPDNIHRQQGSAPSLDIFEFLLEMNNELEKREWLSTQERNALVLAGASAMGNKGKPWQADIHMGKKTLSVNDEKLQQIISTQGKSAKGFHVKNTGRTPLFIDVTMNGYPSRKPDAATHGATIQRRYLNMKGEPLSGDYFHLSPPGTGTGNASNVSPHQGGTPGDRETGLTTGKRLIVELRLKADDRLANALVIDLVPACLELEDPSLEGSSAIDDVVVDGKPISQWHQAYTIRHTEYRDDRFVAALNIEGDTFFRIFYPVRVVTPGDFLVPPPLIEDMYRPYIRGIGETIPLMPVLNP